MTPRRILREPLFHFFVLGALLFAVFAVTNRDALRSPAEIVVDAERIVALGSQFERVWQRPPTPQELEGLIDNWLREEMLYREGLALGFETDDPVIRRRVVQKVTFMTEALVDESTTEAELTQWLDEHAKDYRIEPRISLRQVYFDPARHGDRLEAHLRAGRQALTNDVDAAPGDNTLLPATIRDRTRSDVERSFGRDFAAAVFELPAGEWQGPVPSGFGVHLVYVEKLVPGRAAALDEVRDAVARDLVAERKRRAEQAFVDALRERYTVVMEEAARGNAAAGSP